MVFEIPRYSWHGIMTQNSRKSALYHGGLGQAGTQIFPFLVAASGCVGGMYNRQWLVAFLYNQESAVGALAFNQFY